MQESLEKCILHRIFSVFTISCDPIGCAEYLFSVRSNQLIEAQGVLSETRLSKPAMSVSDGPQ
jgi:hypothetical protein